MARELLERLQARPGDAAEASSAALVVRVGEDDPEALIERLVEAEESGTRLRVDVVQPDEASYETFRL
jgi:hypothetical protein